VQPSPLDDGPPSPRVPDFATLLAPRRADPPLFLGGPGDPILGPVPVTPAVSATPAADEPVPAEPVPAEAVAALPAGHRRTAEPDVVWATARSTEQVLALVRAARQAHPDRPAVVLRASAETLVALASEHDAYTTIDAAARAAAVGPLPEAAGRVAVLCANGGDITVAAEAAFVARVTGTAVARYDDLPATRVGELLADPAALLDVDCLVVVAGLDASLPGQLAAATDVPVVAVPTSAGQPGGLGGLGALMSVLAGSHGVAVSNVDNGYSAGLFAAKLARRSARS
jgi:NCAIR mutase (PurE)-related protein